MIWAILMRHDNWKRDRNGRILLPITDEEKRQHRIEYIVFLSAMIALIIYYLVG
jgi:hypothetical protein